jgi:hypothetical protein
MHCASCYAHSLYKRLMYNIQINTHVKCSTNCNRQNVIFDSTLQSVWSNPIPSVFSVIISGQNRDNSETFLHLLQKGREDEFLKVILVEVRWL